jgi:hypothetical protein
MPGSHPGDDGSSPSGITFTSSSTGVVVARLLGKKEARVRFPLELCYVGQAFQPDLASCQAGKPDLRKWGRMCHGGESALQAHCGGFDSHRLH